MRRFVVARLGVVGTVFFVGCLSSFEVWRSGRAVLALRASGEVRRVQLPNCPSRVY